MNNGKLIRIGIADLNICAPPDQITTLGLGSCVGIVLYDPVSKWSGMVHIMLPDSTKIPDQSNEIKFADTGIDALLKKMERPDISRSRLIAKIAGGATMFQTVNSQKTEIMQIGKRNVDAVKAKLNLLHIPIEAEDTGLNYGRTIIFTPETGDLEIKAVGRESKII